MCVNYSLILSLQEKICRNPPPGNFTERRGRSLVAPPDNSGRQRPNEGCRAWRPVWVCVCIYNIPTSWRSPSAEAYSSQLPLLRRRISPSVDGRKRYLILFGESSHNKMWAESDTASKLFSCFLLEGLRCPAKSVGKDNQAIGPTSPKARALLFT